MTARFNSRKDFTDKGEIADTTLNVDPGSN